MDFNIITQSIPLYLDGLWLTLQLVSLSLMGGLVIAVPLAVVQLSGPVPFRWMVGLWSWFFRGTPLLVQLFLFYNGLGQFESFRDSFMWPVFKEAWYVALIVFTLNTAAYTCEIFRGALAEVSAGQLAAGAACGMSPFQILTRIRLPQAFRQSLPVYSNEIIFMLHGSSLASTITLMDLTGAARLVYSRYYAPVEAFCMVGLIYLSITYTLLSIFRWYEGKMLRYKRYQYS